MNELESSDCRFSRSGSLAHCITLNSLHCLACAYYLHCWCTHLTVLAVNEQRNLCAVGEIKPQTMLMSLLLSSRLILYAFRGDLSKCMKYVGTIIFYDLQQRQQNHFDFISCFFIKFIERGWFTWSTDNFCKLQVRVNFSYLLSKILHMYILMIMVHPLAPISNAFLSSL